MSDPLVTDYSAYQAHARQHPGIQLAFCWAHQRRDFIVLANSYPELWSWSMHWIGQIAELYRLHKLRAQTAINSSEYLDLDVQVHQALQDMAQQREDALSDATLHAGAVKVLRSMRTYWDGLNVFAD